MAIQEAGYQSDGTRCAIARYVIAEGEALANEVVEVVARLMVTFDIVARKRGVSVLTALDPCLMGARAPEGWRERMGVVLGEQGERIPARSVLFQVSADTADERLYVLRLIKTKLGPLATASYELMGDRLTSREEPFGYADGGVAKSPVPRDQAAQMLDARQTTDTRLEVPGEERRGTWLAALEMRHELARFFDRSRAQRNAVIGKEPRATSPSAPPEGSHIAAMRDFANRMVRRSFPFRKDGSEGLMFIALAANPETFAQALNVMRGSDPLRTQNYVGVTSHGVLYVPGASAELLANADAYEDHLPMLAAEQVPANSSQAVLIPEPVGYWVPTVRQIDYFNALKDLGAQVQTANGVTINPDTVAPHIREMHRALVNDALAGATPAQRTIALARLDQLLSEAILSANRVNDMSYMTPFS